MYIAGEYEFNNLLLVLDGEILVGSFLNRVYGNSSLMRTIWERCLYFRFGN